MTNLTAEYLFRLAKEGDIFPDSWSNEARATLRMLAEKLALLDEYQRYRDASPRLPEASRLRLAERILRQMGEAER